ncbi:MAG: DUF2924 domain-containing protein [Hyphomicrobium sp.]
MIKAATAQQPGAAVQAADIDAQLSALMELAPEQLRLAWRRHYRVPPPRGLSRDMLIRAIAYKIQEHAFGGLSKSTLRRLATMARALESPVGPSREPYPSLKPGTKLVREWGGATHTVLVLDDGFEYLGHRYASLTKVAAVISGLHRSGPAFFRLKRAAARFGGRSRASKDEGAAHE